MATRWTQATQEEAAQAREQGARVRRIGNRLEVLRVEGMQADDLLRTPVSELRRALGGIAASDRGVVEEAARRDDRQSAERLYAEWLNPTPTPNAEEEG